MTEALYDHVIVGAGSAGCVLANRLSASPESRVLVLEAGKTDARWDVRIHMPAALSMPIGNPRYDWGYESEPEPHMGGRRVYHARGRVLGGSSSINGMIFIRGNPMDFEGWAERDGMAHFGYAHCLPYFRRSETRLRGGDAFRGDDGPLMLETGACEGPLFDAFFRATEQAGYARTEDVNGYRQEGFGPFDRNVYRGRRHSAARAYLHPVLGKRKNFEVRCDVLVTRILFEGTRAVGVEYAERRGKGALRRVRAGHVLCAGGAFNSPQLLELSGVGRADALRKLGIDVVADLPGVGESLEDHLEVYIQHAAKEPVTLQPALAAWRRPFIGYRWLFHRSGPGATNHFEAGGFIRSNDGVAYPNVQYHFLPLAIRYDGTVPAAGHGYQVHVGPTRSDVRGNVHIESADPRQHPAIRFNYLSTERDRREWLECVRHTRRILAQAAFDDLSAGEISPGPSVESDEALLAWVARDAETALHPACSCRMGTDAMAVVDPHTMGVHGVTGLSVVDASIMPTITNGNLHAPVVMLAEKAADLILGSTPMEPLHVDYYRHEPPGPPADAPARETDP